MEASDRERQSIKKEMRKHPTEASVQDNGEERRNAADQAKTEKPRMTTADFGEPETKQAGKAFDATTAPRRKGDESKDVSQDIQEQATTAPRDSAEKEDSTSGTA